MYFLVIPVAIIAAALFLIVAFGFRRVVSTNEVHILQTSRKTKSYGKDLPYGNVYYQWPSWIPFFGVRVIHLPVSVFQLDLENYAGYDKERVPFMIDVVGFFRVEDSNVAAQRVSDMKELKDQLEFILKGAIRSILAAHDLEGILSGRAEFGEMFTHAVTEQLTEWGIKPVKNLELMDIRDTEQSKVIANIMAKKKSDIEKVSRVTVAGNMQEAQVAEVTANQQVEVQKRLAEQKIGEQEAIRDRQVNIAKQQAQQAIKEQENITMQKAMEVEQTKQVRAAEIARAAELVAADQSRQVTVIEADASKQQQILTADGLLEAKKREAEAKRAVGIAEGDAETAKNMATVTPQITLAKEIGSNEGYQAYLVEIRRIEGAQQVGLAQAQALEKANVKVIANTGSVTDGMTGVGALLTPKMGSQLGALIEAFKNTDAGNAVMAKMLGTKSDGEEPPRVNGTGR